VLGSVKPEVQIKLGACQPTWITTRSRFCMTSEHCSNLQDMRGWLVVRFPELLEEEIPCMSRRECLCCGHRIDCKVLQRFLSYS